MANDKKMMACATVFCIKVMRQSLPSTQPC